MALLESLPTVSSSLRAKDKTKNRWKSATNVFDSHLRRNLTVKDVKNEAAAPTESNPKPAIYSTSFDFGARKYTLLYNPSKTFIPSIVTTQRASIAAIVYVG